MVRFAVIGTSKITGDFLSAASLSDRDYILAAICSRSKQRGMAFGKKYDCTTVYTTLQELAEAPDVDAVYIASPNALHGEQAKLMLSHHKSVLLEKPAVLDEKQLDELYMLAEKNGVVLLEALIAVHVPQRQILKDALRQIGNISTATFRFCQRSSRYDELQSGGLPNIFNPALGAGAMTDLGVYCVYAATDCFGEPKSIKTSAVLLPTGADASFSSLFYYDGFVVNIVVSKTAQGQTPSEIAGDNGSILIDLVSKYDGIRLVKDGKETVLFDQLSKAESMRYEFDDFYDLVTAQKQNEQKYAAWRLQSRTVCRLLHSMRKDVGLSF